MDGRGNTPPLFFQSVLSALRLIHALSLRDHHWRSGSAGFNGYLCATSCPCHLHYKNGGGFGHLFYTFLSSFLYLVFLGNNFWGRGRRDNSEPASRVQRDSMFLCFLFEYFFSFQSSFERATLQNGRRGDDMDGEDEWEGCFGILWWISVEEDRPAGGTKV